MGTMKTTQSERVMNTDYRQEVADGHVSLFRHPTLPLTGYNYTDACTWEGVWTEKTIAARGLVIDDDGLVVSRPMPKFWNLGEDKVELPHGKCHAFEKIDGSCIIVSWCVDYGLVVNTRGSFNSEQAVWARKKIEATGWYPPMGFTYCFEAVYPENRIVVDYGTEEQLHLLAIIFTEDGSEQPLPKESMLARDCPFPTAVCHATFPSIDHAANLAESDAFNGREGIVAVWYGNGQGGFGNGPAIRVKIKHPAYVLAHRLISHLTDHDVWKSMRDEEPLPLDGIADELYDLVKEVELGIHNRVWKIMHNSERFVSYLPEGCSRKSAAALITTEDMVNSAVAFAYLDGNPDKARLTAYKSIEPHPKKSVFAYGHKIDYTKEP